MTRVQCPHCSYSLGVREALAGTVAWCPSCRQKFRLPSVEASPQLQRPAPPREAEDAPQQFAEAPRKRQKESASPVPQPEPVEIIDDPEPEPELAMPLPEDNQPNEKREDRTPFTPKSKKKKKKRDKDDAMERKALHIALAAVGVFVVIVLTLVLFMIQRNASAKETFDPQAVIAEIQQYGGRVERDMKSPDQPVIGVYLGGTAYRAAVLNKLVAFPQLRTLDLSGETTSDLFLEHLHAVTWLRSLNLSHTKVTHGGMQFLTKMVDMEDLNLDQTLVNEQSLEQLKGMTKLKKSIWMVLRSPAARGSRRRHRTWRSSNRRWF
jgi:hypothetical protein